MRKIIVIEDEPAIVDNIAYALRTERFDVVPCPTGREGMAALAGGGARATLRLPLSRGFVTEGGYSP